ncbi:MAG: hypothetical protein ACPGWR_03145 [Ardenticatenaceae bacterium]
MQHVPDQYISYQQTTKASPNHSSIGAGFCLFGLVVTTSGLVVTTSVVQVAEND